MIKAIILDLDGTLLDSSRGIVDKHNAVAKKMGLPPVNEEVFQKKTGEGWHEILVALWPEVNVEEFIRVYAEIPAKPYPPLPGAIDTVKELVGKYRLGIITGTPTERAKRKIADAGFELEWFEFVHGEGDLAVCKPDARAFEKALEVLGLDCSEVIFVGDGLMDRRAANAAGIKFVGVLSGFGTEKDFSGEIVIGSIAELPSILDDIRSP